MHIGKAIKKIRLEKGLKQLEIANEIGIEQASYSLIEKSENVKIKRLKDIAAALKVSHTAILDAAQLFDVENLLTISDTLKSTKIKLKDINDIDFLKGVIIHKDKMLDAFMTDVEYWKQEALRFRSKYETLLSEHAVLQAKLETKK